MSKKLSKFGTLLKRETLASVPSGEHLPCLILHSNDPFPGYYCSEEYPANKNCKEISYYIPVRGTSAPDDEMLFRTSFHLRSELDVDICPAEFNLEKTILKTFRLKGLKEKDLGPVIEQLEEQNYQLYKPRRIKSFFSYIRLRSFFSVQRIDPHFYQNTDSPSIFYMTIPEPLGWNDFEKIITYQKTYGSFKNFDAAIGVWIEKPQVTDFIRIYGNNLETDQLNDIRLHFFRNWHRYKEQGMLI